jgi:predicted TIM-barrel fold metal-dependent hydrolase
VHSRQMELCPLCAGLQSPSRPTRRGILSAIAAAGAAIAFGALPASMRGGQGNSSMSEPPIEGRRRIDVHHHLVPPVFLEANPAYQQLEYFAQWSPLGALRAMDENGIALALTSLNAPGILSSDFPAGRMLARGCNDYAARMVSDHPRRFGMFAAVPAMDPDGSLSEVTYALDDLKADGIGLMTSYGQTYLGSPKFSPLLEELNRRATVVFVHPAFPQFSMAFDPPLPGTFLEMPFDTARAIVGMLINQTFIRFPNIKFIFAHGGGGLPFLHQRIDQAFGSTEKLRAQFPNGMMPALRNVYFDTVNAINEADFALLRQLYSIDQLVFGTDHPTVAAGINAKTITATHLSAAQRSMIEHENIVRLLPRLRCQKLPAT